MKSHDEFLVVAPGGRDSEVIGQLLASTGLDCRVDEDGESLLRALVEGDAAGAIITDAAIARIDPARLREAIENQPPWSDFPFVLLSRRGEQRQGSRAIEDLVNVTILERPLHPASLLSAARSALRGRKRQRLAAKHLSEREKAREELRELADTLEAKVQERTRDLASANDRLTLEIAEREQAEARLVQAHKMEAVGQLTGGIAHDFNNLLTAVVGSLDLLLRRTEDQKLRRLAANALQAAERGATLTSQLLSFSRRQRLTPSPIDPNEVVTGMSDLIARTIGPQVRVETRLQRDLWRALADKTQLEMMILNLAINARDAMPTGGRLTISTRNVSTVPAHLAPELSPGHYICTTVSDTGTGMPPAVLARAFEPFFTTKDHGKGTGLGLAQLYGFARQSGGTVRIKSREGEGTRVMIYLPRTTDDPVSLPRSGSAGPNGNRAHILLVDDDDDVRLVAEAMIEEIGYRVTAVESAEAALKALGSERFAALITDVAMPGMTGVDLARRVRESHQDLPIVFASGYADVETFGEELAEEAVLRKPYRLSEVAARLASAIDGEYAADNVIELRR